VDVLWQGLQRNRFEVGSLGLRLSSMTLYTVGYEGCEVEEFVQFLKKNKIEIIADLRKNPVSRKRGFSKHKLAEQLAKKKIEYVHYVALGTPTIWRKMEKAGRMTRQKMFELFVQQILPGAQKEVQALRDLLNEKNTAILCYEADAKDCHRSFVANEVLRQSKRKIKVVDLHPRPELLASSTKK
jgi:uncharacterized protein (DUF488 family)